MKVRKMQTIVALVVLVALAVGGTWPATAQEQGTLQANQGRVAAPAEFVAGEVLVKFEEGVSASSVQAALERYDAAYVETVYGSDVAVWRVPEGNELAVVDRLNADPAVAYAEPNYVYRAFDLGPNTPNVTPNDPEFGKQWGHTRMNSAAGWDITTGSTGVTIAIIDTGVDPGHPDLVTKLVPGYDFVDNDAVPTDTNGHGTHVAGIAAAATNNGVGVAGVDWLARIMPVRVLGYTGSGTTSAIVSGINWAYTNGAKVLNLSLGGPSYSQTMQDAVTAAHGAGSLVVAAMGNCRTGCDVGGQWLVNPTQYPAAYDNVMAVAATGPTDVYSSFSQYGAHCDIAAPGGDMAYYHDPNGIYSTLPTYAVYLTTFGSYYNNYDFLNGTSQASPHVAGLAALVWARSPGSTPDEVQTTIENTATDLGAAGWDADYGHGRIDLYAALQVGAVPDAPVLEPINNQGNPNYVVNWNNVSGATSYTLEEDDNQAFSSPSPLYNGSNSQFPITGKAAGTTWYYRARATNANGTGPWSNVRSATVKPAAPTLNAISNAGNADEYAVSWSAPTGATGYTLEEDDNASFSSPTTRYVGTALQYNVTGQRGGTWYYRVRATNGGGDSAWSTAQSTTVDPPALTPPILADINNPTASGDYVVDWSDVPTTSVAYTLEESVDPYFANPTVVYTGATTEHQVIDQPGGAWFYRVRAAGQGGRSPWSVTKSTNVTTFVFLPIVQRGYSIVATGPEPGYWEEITPDCKECSYFWVTADRAFVDDFTIRIPVKGCGSYTITHDEAPISNDAFSFTGAFYASGDFSSETTVGGTYGLNQFDIPGCGPVNGGPWTYTSAWQSAVAAARAATAEEVTVREIETDATDAFRVTRAAP